MIEPLLGATSSDESGLVARIRAGDEAAFEALYLAHHAGMWQFAYTYVRSREVAEELVQDVFLAVWGTRATWEVNTRVRAWLYGAVRHLALNHLRHERVVARTIGGRPGQAPLPDAGRGEVERVQAGTIGAPPQDQHSAVEAGELDEAVVRALAELPERRRIAMTLRWKQDMSPLEIARVLGTTPEAVRVLLSRARADLATLLQIARG
jgi:RNA polymerase sigma-70 factor (ECF subfamily)